MTAYLEKADEVLIAVAADVIDRWHPLLRDARIGLLYRSEGKKRGNGKVLAAISLVPSTLAVASGLDYVIGSPRTPGTRCLTISVLPSSTTSSAMRDRATNLNGPSFPTTSKSS